MSLHALISILCSTLVGLVFLLTGSIKALAPSSMFHHFWKLGMRDDNHLKLLVWGSAVAECVLGTALLIRAFPPWILPGTILLVIALAAFTRWSASKAGDDCGCYGKRFSVSPAKSVALNVLYGGLAMVAWRIPAAGFLPMRAQVGLLVSSTVIFSAITKFAHRFYLKERKDWLDLNPLQVGRKWNSDWLQGFSAVASGEKQLVVLMTPACPHCKVWIKPLNKIARRADMPQVIAAMAATEDEIRGLVAEHGIVFPVLRVKESVMDRIAAGYPEVVVLEKGVVQAKPGARIPEDLVERLK